MVILAVKVKFSPRQILVVGELLVTVGTTVGSTINLFEVAVGVVAHAELDVITQLTVSFGLREAV